MTEPTSSASPPGEAVNPKTCKVATALGPWKQAFEAVTMSTLVRQSLKESAGRGKGAVLYLTNANHLSLCFVFLG